MTTSEEAADRWVEQELAAARPVFARSHARGALAFATVEAYETALRRQAAAFLAPVDHLVGLPVIEAQVHAHDRGEHLCEHPCQGHRSYLSAARVHVLVEGGLITAAFRDHPHWLREVEAEPAW